MFVRLSYPATPLPPASTMTTMAKVATRQKLCFVVISIDRHNNDVGDEYFVLIRDGT